MKRKILGTPNRPRLYVFRSNKHLYAQIIDDTKHKVLFSSSSLCQEVQDKIRNKYNSNCKTANIIGQLIAIKSKQHGINHIVFDRGDKLYHGKVKTLADAARKEGLIF